ncbi:VWA domain-containing protein [Sesbania bispinosa]|nr:VWA domain-containing protein [Sesbania bispinosa]
MSQGLRMCCEGGRRRGGSGTGAGGGRPSSLSCVAAAVASLIGQQIAQLRDFFNRAAVDRACRSRILLEEDELAVVHPH